MPEPQDKKCTQTPLLVCLLIAVTVMLFYHIAHQGRIDNSNPSVDNESSTDNVSADTTSGYTNPSDKKRKILPERGVMWMHMYGGEPMVKDDPVVSDSVITNQGETSEQQLYRSLYVANEDGNQIEGMMAPIDEFERSYMVRQSKKHQEVYSVQDHGLVDED